MRLITFPLPVSIASSAASERPESHSTLPEADTPPMSGLEPGIRHVAITLRVLKLITEIEPAERFETNSLVALRFGYSPCAPAPVATNPIRLKFGAANFQTPP